MSVRVVKSLLRPISSCFGLATLAVLAAVSTGIGLGQSLSQDIAEKPLANVTTASAVLQDGDWLSEEAWERRRLKRLRSLGEPEPDKKNQDRSFGSYRTVCVRVCDGYYFPISAATGPDSFAADEQTCQSRCAGDVRLYYYSNAGGGPETMRDRQGRAYGDLKTAFLYRTVYDKSCRCRPEPWSREARERHAMYSTKAWQRQARRIARKNRLRRARLAARSAAGLSGTNSGRLQDNDISLAAPPSLAGFASLPAEARRRALRDFTRPRMSLGSAAAARQRQSPRLTQHRKRRKWRAKAFTTQN